VIVCRARSGDIAPELGAPLNVDSGISGGCLRTANILLCNDVTTDKRVDREACVALGMRSMVVVPIRGAMGVAGILEAFGTRPHAFGVQQIDTLKALAEIAEAAYDREGLSQSPTSASVIAAAQRASLFASLGGAEQTRATRFSGEDSPKPRYWIPAMLAMAMLLISMVGWLSWREPGEISASETRAGVLSASKQRSAHRAPRVLPLKPDSGITGRQSDRLGTNNVLQNAAEIEPATSGPRPSNSNTHLSEANSSERATSHSARPSPVREPPSSAELTATITPDGLASYSAATGARPAFGAGVATGIAEGDLIRKVDPSYPMEARIEGLAGSVVLEAVIAKDGSIREVTVVSGPPLLAATAITAVRQWRYSPSRLDGKPIAVRKRVTILFNLP
jgi:TonB family protein